MAKERMHPTHQWAPRMPSDEALAARDEEDRAAHHEAVAATALGTVGGWGASPARKTWFCWIGDAYPDDVPSGGDTLMREAVQVAYAQTIGHEPHFTFSGWGAALPERYRAVHEDREPDITAQLDELRPYYHLLIDEAHLRGELTDPIDRIAWIRRNIDRGAPESWQVNDFAALATVKLGEAIERLNEDTPGVGLAEPDRRIGRVCLLTAAIVLLDCWERYAG